MEKEELLLINESNADFVEEITYENGVVVERKVSERNAKSITPLMDLDFGADSSAPAWNTNTTISGYSQLYKGTIAPSVFALSTAIAKAEILITGMVATVSNKKYSGNMMALIATTIAAEFVVPIKSYGIASRQYEFDPKSNRVNVRIKLDIFTDSGYKNHYKTITLVKYYYDAKATMRPQ